MNKMKVLLFISLFFIGCAKSITPITLIAPNTQLKTYSEFKLLEVACASPNCWYCRYTVKLPFTLIPMVYKYSTDNMPTDSIGNIIIVSDAH